MIGYRSGDRCPPMLAWAARDLARHPWRNLASALTLFSLALLLATTQLTQQALVETDARLLDAAPSIVVRRSGPTGWAPLPVEAALKTVKKIPGALDPHPRLWGLARVSGQTVTVIADLTSQEDAVGQPDLSPDPGEVIVGGGLEALVTESRLVFDGHAQRAYTVSRRLPSAVSMAAHDVVLMHPGDARRLLGIPAGHASDLAIHVFHDTAIEALGRDLAAAFPWPVQVSTRTAAAGRAGAAGSRSATLASIAYAPAVLALVVLGLAGAVEAERGRARAGLLRALGWAGRDFLRLSLWRWACLCIPSVGLGLAAAYALVFAPGIRWPGPLFFGWTAPPPALYLNSAGSVQVLVQVAALVALPHLAIVVATGLRHTTSDPQILLEEGPP